MKRLEAMHYDRDAFVRAGFGKWREDHIRSAWDGSNFCQYSESMGASFRNQSQGTPDLVFDPKLLGLLTYYEITKTIADCLGYQKAKSVKLIGEEVVAGHSTWHVLVTSPFDEERHFWVEDREGFRVHKLLFKGSVTMEVLSDYDGQGKGDVLPARVTTQTFANTGAHTNEVLGRVVKARIGIPVDPNVGTLASLGIPAGEPVSDERIGRRLGYWNGDGLSDDLTEAQRIGKGREVTAWQRSMWQWVGFSLAVLLVGGLAVFVLRRWWRNRLPKPA